MVNDINRLNESNFWFHWYKELHALIALRENLAIILFTSLMACGFYVFQVHNTASARINQVGLGVILHIISLNLIPLLRSHDSKIKFHEVLLGYKFLLIAILRMIYSGMFFLIPLFIFFLAEKVGFLGQGLNVLMIFILVFVWLLLWALFIAVVLDQNRGVCGLSQSIIKAPWRYFHGVGRAIGNFLIVRLIFGIPLFAFESFAYELVEGLPSFAIIFFITVFGNLIACLLAIQVAVSRMQWSEKVQR